jgi:hypothetical protein
MLFACDRCNAVDNTELLPILSVSVVAGKRQWLCSCCVPNGVWHNQFPKLVYRPGVDIVCNRPSGIGLSCVP